MTRAWRDVGKVARRSVVLELAMVDRAAMRDAYDTALPLTDEERDGARELAEAARAAIAVLEEAAK